ncbi:MAG: sigma-70 family RNA polymerase sigma factor [Caldimonas sp.]
MLEQDRRISDAYARERGRLAGFIRRRVPAPADVEDILQDTFFELVEAARRVKPIEHLGAWLFSVARNRITDLFRKGRTQALPSVDASEDDIEPALDDLLPSPDAGPEAAYARRLLLEAMDDALDELPAAQRDVFIAHELEGRSFKELARETGLGVNTLLSQKHYAVRHLRRRLQAIRDEFIDNEGA